ncbi:universal stress protein [Falsiroseomonas sp.]|uniref:universal stress protein n=1 Tax=Falsiroseomonas sp. TaxID=2870721 RepID=UPI003F7253B1
MTTSMITTIAAHIQPAGAAALDAMLEAPFALAAAHDAHLTILLFQGDPLAAGDAGAAGDEREEQAAAGHVRAAAARRGIRCEVRSRSSFAYGVGEVMADHLRVSDIGLLSLAGSTGPGRRMLIDAAVFEGGRPVLLVPAQARLAVPPARVVVGWDATPAAVRAVQGAMPFIRAAAETIVVTVSDDKALRPGQSGTELCHLLARHGARASVANVPMADRGVLHALAAKAAEVEGALLVMGAVRHAPIRTILFGSATSELLDSGPRVPVLISA